MTVVEQWPFTAEGSVQLLRMKSSAGADVPRPKRLPGLVLRELVLRGILIPGSTWSVRPVEPLPFRLRWETAYLAAATEGSLPSMISASFTDEVRRKAMNLPPMKKSWLQLVKEEFTGPSGTEAAPVPTAQDAAESFEGRGLAHWTETRWLSEQVRTPEGDEWAVRGADLLSQLGSLEELARSDAAAAAALLQSAGALTAVVPQLLSGAQLVVSSLPAGARPEATGHPYAFDVLAAIESVLRIAPLTVLDDVSTAFQRATASSPP